jgi:hypothetical protein
MHGPSHYFFTFDKFYLVNNISSFNTIVVETVTNIQVPYMAEINTAQLHFWQAMFNT